MKLGCAFPMVAHIPALQHHIVQLNQEVGRLVKDRNGFSTQQKVLSYYIARNLVQNPVGCAAIIIVVEKILLMVVKLTFSYLNQYLEGLQCPQAEFCKL